MTKRTLRHAIVAIFFPVALTICAQSYAIAGTNTETTNDDPFAKQKLPGGSFIVLRPVPTRSAETPEPPAPPHYVVLGGKDEVLAAVELGLKPMSDSEQSAVLAQTTPVFRQIPDATHRALDLMSGSSGVNSTSIMQEHSTGVGSTVRDAMGALPSALGAMRDALGGGQ